MSKAYTALLALQAIEQGRFDLDTRIADLLPRSAAAGSSATVRQLLAHTAGLPTALVPPPLGPDKAGDLGAKVPAICAIPAAYEPGTRCVYTSGMGYDLLGCLVALTDPARPIVPALRVPRLSAGRTRSGRGDAPSGVLLHARR